MDKNPQEGATPSDGSGQEMPEQANVPNTEPQPVINNEHNKKSPTSAIVGIVVLIAALVGVLYYFTPSGWPFSPEVGAFNIPEEGEHILLFDGGTLFALNLTDGKTKELGVFKNGNSVATANEVAISEDRSHIALAVPRSGGGNDILVFSDFKTFEQVASQSKYLQALSVSNQGAVLFEETTSKGSPDSKVYFISRAISNGVESLGTATAPLFVDGGRKIVHGTAIGYKMIDLEAGDSLETESRKLPEPWKVDLSSNSKYFALMDFDGVVGVHEVVSTRPFRLDQRYLYPLLEVNDASVSPEGNLALVKDEGGNTSLTVVEMEDKKATIYSLPTSKNTLLVSWNK